MERLPRRYDARVLVRFGQVDNFGHILPSICPSCSIKIKTSIAKGSDGTLGARPQKRANIQISNCDHFDVLGCFCSNTVASERKIARCQNCGLSILDVQIGDVVEIADHAGRDDVDLVLYGSGLRAVSNAQVTCAGIGVVRNKQDACAFISKTPCGFGKLCVITDEHSDGSTIGIDDLYLVPAGYAPRIALIRCGVKLLLRMDGAVA